MRHLYRAPTWHPAVRRRLAPTKAAVAGTLDLSAFDFGAFVGATVGSLGRDDGVDYKLEVFAHGGTLGNPLWTSGVLTTSGAGKIANQASATFVVGTQYDLIFTRQSDFQKAWLTVAAA